VNIFVGNLSFDTTEAELKQLFETMGEVSSAVIVMEKEKKAPKSRGFGFVEMPDESQALSAIAALNGKDFMGRILDVNPTRPKTDTQRENELKKKILLKSKMKERPSQYQNEGREEKKTEVRPFISRPGTYKGGRRTRSYVLRTGGIVDMDKGTKPWQKRQENPMRWRNRQDQQKLWQRGASERKPWDKAEGASAEARPWRKFDDGGPKSWQKSAGGAKPWKRSSSGRKPWEKTEGTSQEARPWKKPVGISKPWQRGTSERKSWEKKPVNGAEVKPWKRGGLEAKSWEKTEGVSKPWVKRGKRPQGSRFKSSGKRAKIIVDKRG
jgi:hypothetical protein